MLITLLQLEFIPDYRIAAAGVDQIFSANALGETCFLTSGDAGKRLPPRQDGDTVLIESYIINRGFLTHFRARLRRVIQQHLVKFRSRHLIGAVGARTESILEVKLCRFFSTGFSDLAAKFFDKTGAQFFL